MNERNAEQRGLAMATIIDSADQAEALAEHLLDPARPRPVVVVTTAAGQSRPYINVSEILGAVSELAEVYLLHTGNTTFAMSDLLPAKTQVYGGAGRVYPVDSAWQSHPYAAPLRFAFGEDQGKVATDRLIADALGAAHSAGLDTRRADATVMRVEGSVMALFAPSRAVVRTDDDRHAAIWQELMFPGLALERAFRVGMRISGVLDVEKFRIDVSASQRKAGEALAEYGVGIVVLARVVKLDNIEAVVELYPGTRTGMSASEVTGNPMDRLTTLMSVDEVLPVRVTSRGGHDGRGWRLTTLDVEDTEEIMASPSLLPGGPPWLVMDRDAPELAAAPPRTSAPASRIQPALDVGALPEPFEPGEPGDPGELGQPGETLPELLSDLLPAAVDELGSLRLQVAELGRLLQVARTLEHEFQFERDGFREQASESHARVQQLGQSAEKARTELRIEKQKSQRLEKQARSAKAQPNGPSSADVLFLDPVEQYKFEVDIAYAHQIPAGEKQTRPRRELRLGLDFLATLGSLEGIDRAKVVDVTVQIITDLVKELDGRELHPLRSGDGATGRAVVRPADDARCMRVALQRKTPSARRLHYWKVGDAIELSRVVKHDDMTP
jgi:hypothetical protein